MFRIFVKKCYQFHFCFCIHLQQSRLGNNLVNQLPELSKTRSATLPPIQITVASRCDRTSVASRIFCPIYHILHNNISSRNSSTFKCIALIINHDKNSIGSSLILLFITIVDIQCLDASTTYFSLSRPSIELKTSALLIPWEFTGTLSHPPHHPYSVANWHNITKSSAFAIAPAHLSMLRCLWPRA